MWFLNKMMMMMIMVCLIIQQLSVVYGKQTLDGDAKVHERNMLLSVYREVTANAGDPTQQAAPQVCIQYCSDTVTGRVISYVACQLW